ncbi:MAG: FYDLN acid domain-containing protein [Nitrospinota bacterium]|nr:FYDLN acid domain-containing protein [Nitrospinota bacterium]
MVDPKWGKRYTCHKCGVRFYDLNKPEPKCPKCNADPSKAPVRGSSSRAKTKAYVPVEVEADDIVDTDDDTELVADDEIEDLDDDLPVL